MRSASPSVRLDMTCLGSTLELEEGGRKMGGRLRQGCHQQAVGQSHLRNRLGTCRCQGQESGVSVSTKLKVRCSEGSVYSSAFMGVRSAELGRFDMKLIWVPGKLYAA
jgi:hypothetical protein